ncbi:beta strand repeat-containing protein [Geomonas sp. Red276]
MTDDAEKQGQWLIVHAHTLNGGADNCYGHMATTDFTNYLDYLKTKNLAVRGIGPVVKYVNERATATLSVFSETNDQTVLSLSDTLDDSLYNEPLTVRSTVPSGWLYVSVQQENSITTIKATVEGSANVIYYHAVPDKGLITLQDITTPRISEVYPRQLQAGSPALELLVTGQKFDVNSTFRWNGTDRATTVISPTQLLAAIDATDIASPGNASVTVYNRVAGGGTSNALPVEIQATAPPPQPLAIATTSLSAGTVALFYTQNLTATGGQPPYRWSIAAGSLPPGLNIDPATGTVSGIPTSAGTGSFTVQLQDASQASVKQNLGITIYAPLPPIGIGANVSTDAGTTGSDITSPTVTTGAGELLVAFIGSSGPATGTNATVTGVTNTGDALTWTKWVVTNAQRGTAEIWWAYATSAVTGTVTATLNQSVSSRSITVMSFTKTAYGADAIGATGSGSAASGAPTASLVTTRANSLVLGTGNDWSHAVSRTVGSGQSLVHSFLSTATGDTYWVQRLSSATAAAGTTVTINDTAPTADMYNLSIVEIRGQSAPLPLEITTASLASGTAGVAYPSQNLAATGGAPPYAWSAAGLPPGLIISGAGVISGTPASVGSFTVTISVTDSVSTSTANNLTIAIAPPPPLAITTAALPSGTVAEPYPSQALSATGGIPPYGWSAAGLPPGLAMSGTGVITGTPLSAGIFTVALSASDSSSTTVSENFNIGIAPPPALSITTTSLPAGIVAVPYPSQNMVASGGIPPYLWAATGLPPGLIMSSAGVLSGTPASAGSFTVAVSVTDSSSGNATKNLNIEVAPVPALTITTASLPPGTTGASYPSQNLAATGGIAPYTWSATGLPSGLTVSGSGVLGGTPASSGTFATTISVTDSSLTTATKNINITIAVPAIGINANVSADSSAAGSRITSPAVTAGAYELVVAFIGGSAPTTGTNAAVTGVTNTGNALTWTRGVVTNGQRGTAEIWWAYPTAAVTGTVTATLNQIVSSRSITVMTFTGTAYGADAIGATGSASAASGAPAVSLVTTRAGSVVLGTGNDWSQAVARTPGSGQVIVHTFLSTATGDTFWVQKQSSATPLAGTTVTIDDTAPTGDRYNLSAIEIRTQSVAASLAVTTASLAPGSVGVSYPGQPLAATGGAPPYAWSATGLPPGLTLSGAGVIGGTPAATGTFTVAVTVSDSLSATDSKNLDIVIALAPDLAIDVVTYKDATASTKTIKTPSFSTKNTNELLVAFIAAAPKSGSTATTVSGLTNTGGSLTWTLAQRANTQRGTAEIWWAYAPSVMTGTVTATLNQSVSSGTLTVVSFTGTAGGASAIGATAGASAASGVPAASLVTTGANSWVFGIGNDPSSATSRTLGPVQRMVHQLISTTNHASYWVQSQTGATPAPGTTVTINDTAPAADSYNLSIVEIRKP